MIDDEFTNAVLELSNVKRIDLIATLARKMGIIEPELLTENLKVMTEFKDGLRGTTLLDWCKLANYDVHKVFAFLQGKGDTMEAYHKKHGLHSMIDGTDNRLLQHGLDTFNPRVLGDTIATVDLVMFNTNKTADNTYTVIINAMSPAYTNFKDLLYTHRNVLGEYRGSKKYTKSRICKVMTKHLGSKCGIVIA